MNGQGSSGRYMNEQQSTVQLAQQFNEFYLSITSPEISQIGNYRITREIGEGAFGKVYLARHILLNINVVLKCGKIDDPNIVREIYYHKQLKHKNIVSLYEVIKTENHLWIALEYCEGGELYYLVYEKKRLSVKEAQHIFFQIVLGVQFVHSFNLSHRDLKLENILLADKRKSVVKLTDFGFIREFNPSARRLLSTICGTTVYMAPELLMGSKYSGFAIDVWSLGVILYTMLYGILPFDDDDEMKTRVKIMNEQPLLSDHVPTEVNQLILKLLSKNPIERPSIGELLNSSFLIDLYNRYLEKSMKKTHGDAESIISINQHYNCIKKPFDTRIEKDLLRRLQKLNFDVDDLEASVYRSDMNSLTAMYELLLTQEFSKKKKRYIREKKRKYIEATRRSRKRVKSALSISDQYIGSQPLERIISSLSLASNRNSSKTNLAKQSLMPKKTNSGNSPKSPIQGRFSSEQVQGSQISQISQTSQPQGQLMEIKELSGRSKHSAQTLSPKSSRQQQQQQQQQQQYLQQGPPLERTVSFVPEERRNSITHSHTESTKRNGGSNKGGKILNKLQFWKKNRGDYEDEKDDRTSYESNRSDKYTNDSDDQGLEIKIKPSPEKLEHRNTPLGISNKINIGNGNSKSNSNSNNNNSNNSNNSNNNNNNSNNSNKKNNRSDKNYIENNNDELPRSATFNLEEPSSFGAHKEDLALLSPNTVTTPRTPPPIEGRATFQRARPSSMISQISQISRLSQMSTMLSESELDILDETDTMDDEYDDDDAYESSLNVQSDSRSGSIVVANSSRLPPRKRPSYRRALSSDQSVNTSSSPTGFSSHGVKKRSSLTMLPSNSSEDMPNELLKQEENMPLGIDGYDNETRRRERSISQSSQTGSGNQAGSQRNISQITYANGNSGGSFDVNANANANANASYTPSNTATNILMNGGAEPYPRAASPPVTFKLNLQGLNKDPKLNKKQLSPTFGIANGNSTISGMHLPRNYQPAVQVTDATITSYGNSNINGAQVKNKSTLYGPIIDEEEEDEDLY